MNAVGAYDNAKNCKFVFGNALTIAYGCTVLKGKQSVTL